MLFNAEVALANLVLRVAYKSTIALVQRFSSILYLLLYSWTCAQNIPQLTKQNCNLQRVNLPFSVNNPVLTKVFPTINTYPFQMECPLCPAVATTALGSFKELRVSIHLLIRSVILLQTWSAESANLDLTIIMYRNIRKRINRS